MVELINQRNDRDCVIACIAMWAKISYEEVLEVAKKLNIDITGDKMGISTVHEYMILKKLGKDTMMIQNAYGSLTGILSFPSLNNPGGAHAVFFDRGKIYDPQTGREDRKWYPVDMSGLWPSCYKLRIDLKDPESCLMAQAELNSLQSHINRATGKEDSFEIKNKYT